MPSTQIKLSPFLFIPDRQFSQCSQKITDALPIAFTNLQVSLSCLDVGRLNKEA
jgi:hypothetical protein